jgi:hypothetical protein
MLLMPRSSRLINDSPYTVQQREWGEGALSSVAMTFVMQRHTSSGWVISVKGSVTTNSKGYAKAIYRYTGTGFIGMPMRTHIVWVGDADHVGGTSPWTYLRLTT